MDWKIIENEKTFLNKNKNNLNKSTTWYNYVLFKSNNNNNIITYIVVTHIVLN